MSKNKIASIILAAGRGRRMGLPKALLSWRGATFLEHLVQIQHNAGIRDFVIVVLPSHLEQLQQGCYPLEPLELEEGSSLSITWVVGDPEEEQFTSLQRGVQRLSDLSWDAVLAGPVDQGPYAEAIIEALSDRQQDKDAFAWVPTFEEKWGHPVLLSKSCIRTLPKSHEQGLRGFFLDHASSLEFVPVPFPEILRNLNTPDAFASFLEETGEPLPPTL